MGISFGQHSRTHMYTPSGFGKIMRFWNKNNKFFSASDKKKPLKLNLPKPISAQNKYTAVFLIAFNVTCNAMSWKYTVAHSSRCECVSVCVYETAHTWTFTHARITIYNHMHARTHTYTNVGHVAVVNCVRTHRLQWKIWLSNFCEVNFEIQSNVISSRFNLENLIETKAII